MFADMVEFSKRLEQDEAGNSVQAARAIELFKALVGDYGTSHTVPTALSGRGCAVSQNQRHGSPPISLRMGAKSNEILLFLASVKLPIR